MPAGHSTPARKSRTVLWISLGIAAGCALLCCAGVGVGTYVYLGRAGVLPPGVPALGGAAVTRLDPDNVENTRLWSADAVKRLKAADGKGNAAAEVAKVEKELKDGLLGKKIRWTFPVEAVDQGEVKLDTFFGTDAGLFPKGPDPKLSGQPMRRLYFRAFFGDEGDSVRVGDEVTPEQAKRLAKGSSQVIARTVVEVGLTKHDKKWVSQSSYSPVVDVLEPYCVTIILARK